jgi:secondary thiamine-phosphate synthase enzyme
MDLAAPGESVVREFLKTRAGDNRSVNIAHTTLPVSTKGKGLYSFTRAVADWLSRQNVKDGLLTVFVQHTSCSLVIQENADPDVVLDMRDFYERLVPETSQGYRHTTEGPDDMTSHIRSSLTSSSVSIPVIAGEMALGTWQGLYVFEHRRHPHTRTVVLQLIGN